jgi:hypothetical protein
MMFQATSGRQETGAPKGIHNRATKGVAACFGVFAGLLGVEHGFFEMLQGPVVPGHLLISAIGSPCQPQEAWHACEPAMTIIPNFFVTGVFAIIVSLMVVIWAAAFLQRTHGGLVLTLLALMQLLVGGGFIPVLVLLIAGMVGTRIHASLTWWRVHLALNVRRVLAALWPWSLIAYFLVESGLFLLGFFFNAFLTNLGTLPGFVLPLGLVLLTVLTGFAHDIQSQTDSSSVALEMSGGSLR